MDQGYPHRDGYVEADFSAARRGAAERPVLRRKLDPGCHGRVLRETAADGGGDGSLRGRAPLGSRFCALGHEVRLIAPQLAKPYVKRGKNDAADAEALCEAASRPTMRFVPSRRRTSKRR